MGGLEKSRDISVDIFRGFAIFIMIAANLAAEILAEPHSMVFRFYSSFAAPIFIMLSGYMTSYSAEKKDYKFVFFLKRGLSIFLFAILIDVLIWRIYPMISFDVLYIIAIGIPLTYVVNKLKLSYNAIIILAVICIAPVMQNVMAYSQAYVDFELSENPGIVIGRVDEIGRSFIVNGWFPIFPWIAIPFMGSVCYKIRKKMNGFANIKVLVTGLLVFVIGFVLFFVFPSPMYARDGYSELFYPANAFYVIMAVGIITLLFSIIDFTVSLKVYTPLRILGERSLLIYVLHNVIIHYIIAEIWADLSMIFFIPVYLGLVAFFVFLSYFTGWLKKYTVEKRVKLPYLVKMLI